MRKSYIYALFAACLINFSACDREEVPVVEEPGEFIRVEASGTDPQTRGLLNKADLKKAGTRVKVYDYLTGFTGKINNQSYTNGSIIYIDDSVTLGTDGGSDWKFSSFDWRWTRTGVHHFYGWLEHDAQSGMDIPSGWATVSSDKKSLSVGPFALKADSPQFDFSYSDIVTVDVEGDGFDPNGTIVLPLKHLFSALAVTVTNSSPDNAFIKEITISGLFNKRSASIAFDTDSQRTAVNFGTGSYEQLLPNWPAESTEDPTYGHSVPKATSSSSGIVPTRFDIIKARALGANEELDHILMWPQLASEFENAQIHVQYYMEGVLDTENESDPTALKLQDKTFNIKEITDLTSLDAGVKYALNLEFKDKTINLRLIPLPWTMVYEDLDYSTNTIQANSNNENEGVLWLYYQDENDNWKAGNSNRLITMPSGKTIQGRFFILAPQTGQWQITTYPAEASEYFTIEPSSGSIEDLVNIDGSFNGKVVFDIKPKGVVPATTTLHFNVDIMMNGQWRNANTEFNRKDWRLTREP